MNDDYRKHLLFALICFALGVPVLLGVTFYEHIDNIWLNIVVVFLFFGWLNLMIDYIHEMRAN